MFLDGEESKNDSTEDKKDFWEFNQEIEIEYFLLFSTKTPSTTRDFTNLKTAWNEIDLFPNLETQL